LAPWSTFAQVAGTAAASLIGLLFVAVSIRIDFIARSQELRNRAAQTLSLFGTVLVTAILIAIPGQATEALGAELTALAVIAGGGLLVLDRRAKADASTQAIRKTLEVITPTTIVSILLLVSGVLLVFGVRGGLYVLIVPVLAALTGGRQRLAVSHKDHRIAAPSHGPVAEPGAKQSLAMTARGAVAPLAAPGGVIGARCDRHPVLGEHAADRLDAKYLPVRGDKAH